jgi:16S rRNA (uracil1498-N3)-methyltransferase
MRLHRFIGNFNLNSTKLVVSDTEFINQWRNVLRLKTGDTLILCDGVGKEAEASIEDMTKNEIILSIKDINTPDTEPQKKSTLYCALLKRENFELVVQKATEIGIAKIVPLLTERTVKTGFNRDRLEKIIREASEQSGRTVLPSLSDPLTLIEAIEATNEEDSVLFDLSGSKEVHFNLSTSHFFIGPEGGFSEKEVQLAKEKGVTVASLGSLTFRGETAAIVVSYLAVQ